jgi:PAS domain S-box-containing protein
LTETYLPIVKATGAEPRRDVSPNNPANRRAFRDAWKNHVEAIKTRASLLQDAEALAGIGSWEFDLVNRTRTWSDQMLRIMEVDLDRETAGVDPVWSRLYPEDREAVRACLDRAIVERTPFALEFRAHLPSGRDAVFSARGRVLCDRAGQPTRLIGVTWDVTAQREREERLLKREALLLQTERVANLGTWHHDYRTDKLTASEDLMKIYGLRSQEEFDRKLHWTRMDPSDHEQALRNMARAKEECGTFDVTLRYHHPDGGLRILNLRCVSLPGEDGTPVSAIGVTQDVTKRAEHEEGLRKNQMLLSHAERIAQFGSWERDLATGRMCFSKHAVEIFGLASESEWTSESHWERVHPADRKSRDTMRQAWAEGRAFDHVLRYRRPDGEQRIFHTRGLTLQDAAGTPVRAIGVVQDVTEQRRAEEELHRLSRRLMHTRDNERRRLARELHESAGQSLAALKMTLGCIRDQLPQEPGVSHLLLQSAGELADEAIREVRTISYLIHPPLLDEAGLGLALRLYLKGFSDRSGIEVKLEGDEDFGRTVQEAETTLFRVVQEALTNVHRHSGSRTAQVHLARAGGKMIVEVSDQGRGLPDARRARHRGVGIAGMLERVKHLNGELEFASEPGQGTTIRAILPDFGTDLAHETSTKGDSAPASPPAAMTQHPNPVPREQSDGQEAKSRRRRAAAR